jgi:alpha-galactosidase
MIQNKCLTGIIFLLLITSCSMRHQQATIDLSASWKFKTGDSLSWAAPGFNDSGWGALLPIKPWEDQGFKGYDGFAWYRIRVVIPSIIREKAYLKDSLQIVLGKIDDCDQVFLNGVLIGENGKTILEKRSSENDFIKTRGVWNLMRKYILPVGDPRISWDKENVIAVRVFDQGGLGGMFSSPQLISMRDIGDYINIDLQEEPFSFIGDSLLMKKYVLSNTSAREDFNGNLKIRAILCQNGNTIFEENREISLKKLEKLADSVKFKVDYSAPVLFMISFTEAKSGKEITGQAETPYIVTPKVPDIPRINGAKIFGVRPWSPFLFHVAATGQPPLAYSADNLPKGLKIDPMTGIITGSTGKKGEFMVKLKVENALGSASGDLKIVVGNKISLTPPLGWNSWNCWGLSVSDRKVRESAESMKSSGLSDHGWIYINIDDGWEDKHDKDGNILTNSKFPDMKKLCDYIHSLGLKTGIYSSPGTKTCGGYEGSYTFEEKDASAYAGWGIDYLKYDWCSYEKICPDPVTQEQFMHPYRVMKNAIRKVNRDIHYSLCQYGMGDVWTWGAEVDGNSWRTTGDIEDSWESMSGIGFSQDKCSPFAAPSRWNDPDMLVVGYVGWGPDLHFTRLTPDEQYTHISLWCLLSAPLLIGCDLSRLDPFTLNLLTNDEVLAVNQDPLGKQAVQVKNNSNYAIWAKDLEDGSKAAGLFNLTADPLNVHVDLNDLAISGYAEMRDLWRQKDLGAVALSFEVLVQPHGVALLKLTPGRKKMK